MDGERVGARCDDGHVRGSLRASQAAVVLEHRLELRFGNTGAHETHGLGHGLAARTAGALHDAQLVARLYKAQPLHLARERVTLARIAQQLDHRLKVGLLGEHVERRGGRRTEVVEQVACFALCAAGAASWRGGLRGRLDVHVRIPRQDLLEMVQQDGRVELVRLVGAKYVDGAIEPRAWTVPSLVVLVALLHKHGHFVSPRRRRVLFEDHGRVGLLEAGEIPKVGFLAELVKDVPAHALDAAGHGYDHAVVGQTVHEFLAALLVLGLGDSRCELFGGDDAGADVVQAVVRQRIARPQQCIFRAQHAASREQMRVRMRQRLTVRPLPPSEVGSGRSRRRRSVGGVVRVDVVGGSCCGRSCTPRDGAGAARADAGAV